MKREREKHQTMIKSKPFLFCKREEGGGEGAVKICHKNSYMELRYFLFKILCEAKFSRNLFTLIEQPAAVVNQTVFLSNSNLPLKQSRKLKLGIFGTPKTKKKKPPNAKRTTMEIHRFNSASLNSQQTVT